METTLYIPPPAAPKPAAPATPPPQRFTAQKSSKIFSPWMIVRLLVVLGIAGFITYKLSHGTQNFSNKLDEIGQMNTKPTIDIHRAEKEASDEAIAKAKELEAHFRSVRNGGAGDSNSPVVSISDVAAEMPDYGGMNITGIIKNLSDAPLNAVSVNYSIFDNSGNKVDVVMDFIQQIRAGETWKFKASSLKDGCKTYRLDSINSIAGPTEYKLQFQWRPTKALKSGERDEFPSESACARQNEIKDFVIMSVI
jgi:hypothetical protein